MKKNISAVMREFYEEGIPTDIIPRSVEYVEKSRCATVITGMRRTGKTYVTYQRMQELVNSGIPLERIVHINFDDERLMNVKVEDLNLIGEIHAEMFPQTIGQKCWYFLDELQDIQGWEYYARRLTDSPLVQLCLTGSTSRLLSSEIATQMRGRSFDIENFPLSFAEFLIFNKIVKEIPAVATGISSRTLGTLRNAMNRYFIEGGFPDVQGITPRVRNRIIQGYIDTVIFRDVIERHAIPSVQSLRYTLDYIIHNYARKISTRAISAALKQIGISNNREYIANYLDYLMAAYLIYKVPLRTDSLAVRRTNPDKYYLIDQSVVHAMSPKNDAERGWLLENIVFMSLRRGDNLIEYFVTKDGNEVDFLVTDTITKERKLIQVAWEVSQAITAERELTALRAAGREMKINDQTLVTWDTALTTEDGIKIVPVWQWLLADC